jgi:hypothetical protein
MSINPWLLYPLAGVLIVLGVYVGAAIILAVIVATREALTYPYH